MTTAKVDPLYVGLDVGGTNMKAGVVDDSGTPLSGVSLPTEAHRGQDFGLERMCDTIREAAAAAGVGLERISAIGVATPGSMDIPAGMILKSVNMPWLNVPVRRHVQETFGLPTAFQNDANAAAYGEFWAGAGRGARSMVLFTLGTGVGGGIIVAGDDGGFVIEGEHSHGGEIGHIKIEMTRPRPCGCGGSGCLEAYASATSVAKRASGGVGGGRRPVGTSWCFTVGQRADFTAHLRRRERRGRVGRPHRGRNRTVFGGWRDEPDARDRPGPDRVRRGHDRGGRRVPGPHPGTRASACVPGPGGAHADRLRPTRRRRRFHRGGGVRPAVSATVSRTATAETSQSAGRCGRRRRGRPEFRPPPRRI